MATCLTASNVRIYVEDADGTSRQLFGETQPVRTQPVSSPCVTPEEMRILWGDPQAVKPGRVVQAERPRLRLVASTVRPRPIMIGRNAPCPCGSGLKFKRCHLAQQYAGGFFGFREEDRA